MIRHSLAHEIIQQALRRHAHPDPSERLTNDDLLIVMGAVLEEVTSKPRSLKVQGGIVGVVVAAIAGVSLAVDEITKLLGR